MAADTTMAGEQPVLRPVRQRRMFATTRAVLALMLREMATTNGRSPIGYLWAVLEPAAGIGLLTLIFSLGFKSPPMGTNFPIFYATGLVPFMMYMDVSNKMMASLMFSRNLLAYPSVTVIDALLGRFILNFLTQVMVAYVIFSGILILTDTRSVVNLPAIALGLLMVAALSFGVGVMNCFLSGLMPSYKRIWAVLNRPMVLISCVIFLFDTIPQPYRDWLWYNPLVHIVGQFRRGFYPYYDAHYVSPSFVFGISLTLTAVGLLFLKRYYRFILNY